MKLTDDQLLRTQAYVDGHWVDAEGGKTHDVLNPATGDHHAFALEPRPLTAMPSGATGRSNGVLLQR
jgi:hypothetical protein